MSSVEPSSITALCLFGADVGSKLVRLSKWVDGMPTTVKSLGYEIWAACEVLCELANILARGQQNSRSSFFNADAMKEIEEYLETCDEIFHEAARGVLVAYDRLRAIRPKDTVSDDKDDEKEEGGQRKLKTKKPRSKPLVAEVICLSMQERVQWPLFQKRIRSMMEVLIEAKTDLTLHLLVYWVSWEQENRRRSRSSLFAEINPASREALVDQLWQSKIRREHETDSSKMPTWSSNLSEGSPTKAPSIFAVSNSGSSSPDTNSGSSSPLSTRSNDSVFSRLSHKLSKSSRKGLVALGFIAKKRDFETDRDHRPQARSPAESRSPSRTLSGSTNWDQQSSRGGGKRLRRAESSRPPLRSERYSYLSLTESQNSITGRPSLIKRASWCAGPTKSAKEGIIREWEVLRNNEYDLLWQNEEGDVAGLEDFRDLGRQLLFRQLEAMIPVWAVPDGEQVAATIDMLTENWIEPGQFRKRRMEWESIVDGTRSNYMYTSAENVGMAGRGAREPANRFLFSN